MDKNLTDRNFWVSFWESKKDITYKLTKRYLFGELLIKIVSKNHYQSAIELGGFPGYFSVYMKKFCHLEVTLLDYFVHSKITDQLLEANDLQKNDVAIIETDLFNYKPQKTYDIVLSVGLVEHFWDTEDIIKRHISFLKPKGTLLITIPNFNSLNGWFQKTFDIENYKKHNIDSMNPILLAQIVQNLGLELVQSRYYGNFGLWLENESEKSKILVGFKNLVWFVLKVATKIIPFNSKILSPYIILEAKRM